MSAEDKAPETKVGFERDSQVRQRIALGLRLRDRLIPLNRAEMLLGRAVECAVVLDGPLVSRRHARIVVSPARVTIEDLGSRNGVQLDGRTISGATELRAGTQIRLGDEVLEVVEVDAEVKRRVTASDFRSAHTMRFERPVTQPEEVTPPPGKRAATDDPGETTLRAQSFELLSSVVDKALAMGRGDEAERMLGGLLTDALKDAQGKKKVSRELAERAARSALKLARATGKPSWINYVFRLYSALLETVPLALVDEMYTLLRRVRGADRALIEDYLDLLRQQKLGPAERFALQRIEGLVRLAAL